MQGFNNQDDLFLDRPFFLLYVISGTSDQVCASKITFTVLSTWYDYFVGNLINPIGF